MKRFLSCLYIALFCGAGMVFGAAKAAKPAPQSSSWRQIPLKHFPVVVQFNRAEGCAHIGGTRCTLSQKFSDSKGWVFVSKEFPGQVLKIYGGPRYSENQQQMVNEWGEQELKNLKQWAELGIAPQVLEEGYTEDGVLYAVLAEPAGAAVVNLSKLEAELPEEVIQAIRNTFEIMAENGILEPTTNPTQFVVDGDRATLVKAYTHAETNPAPTKSDKEKLSLFYKQKLGLFKEWPGIWKAFKAKERLTRKTCATSLREKAAPKIDLAQFQVDVARMVLESIRIGCSLVMTYINNEGQIKTHYIQVDKDSLEFNHIWKGFFNARYVEDGKPKGRPFRFRLDHILEVRLLLDKETD